MASRLDLHAKLVELLGSNNCYYQPPESLKMQYPCIRYKKSKVETRKADNINYQTYTRYDITVISKRPDHPVINKLLSLPRCSYDRWYVSDGLNHDSLTLYF